MRHDISDKVAGPCCTLFLGFVNSWGFIQTSCLPVLLCVVLRSAVIPSDQYSQVVALSMPESLMEVFNYTLWRQSLLLFGFGLVGDVLPINYQLSRLQSVSHLRRAPVKLLVTWKWSRRRWERSLESVLSPSGVRDFRHLEETTRAKSQRRVFVVMPLTGLKLVLVTAIQTNQAVTFVCLF